MGSNRYECKVLSQAAATQMEEQSTKYRCGVTGCVTLAHCHTGQKTWSVSSCHVMNCVRTLSTVISVRMSHLEGRQHRDADWHHKSTPG